MDSDNDLQAYLSQLTRSTHLIKNEDQSESSEFENIVHDESSNSEGSENLVNIKLKEAERTRQIKAPVSQKSVGMSSSKLSLIAQKYAKKRRSRLLSSDEDDLSKSDSTSLKQNIPEIKSALELQENNAEESVTESTSKNSSPNLVSSKKSNTAYTSDGGIKFENILTVEDILGQMTDNSSNINTERNATDPDNNSSYRSISSESKRSSILSPDPTSVFLPKKKQNKKEDEAKSSNLLLREKDSPFRPNKSEIKESNKVETKSTSLLADRQDSPFLSTTHKGKENSSIKEKPSLLLATRKSPFLSRNSQSEILISHISTENDSIKTQVTESGSEVSDKADVAIDESQPEIKSPSLSEYLEKPGSHNDNDIEKSLNYNEQNNQPLEDSAVKSSSSRGKQNKSEIKKNTRKNKNKYNRNSLHNSIKIENKGYTKKYLPINSESDSSDTYRYKSCRIKIHKRSKYLIIKIPKEYLIPSSESSSTSDAITDDIVYIPYTKHHSRKSTWKKRANRKTRVVHLQPYPQNYMNILHPVDNSLKGEFGPCSVQSVEDALKFTVDLTKQFMDSHTTLHDAYRTTLSSKYNYTSLRNTEEYIKKNKKEPLSFNEAYKEVIKEEKTRQS